MAFISQFVYSQIHVDKFEYKKFTLIQIIPSFLKGNAKIQI